LFTRGRGLSSSMILLNRNELITLIVGLLMIRHKKCDGRNNNKNYFLLKIPIE
jgi:hypothetical protein